MNKLISFFELVEKKGLYRFLFLVFVILVLNGHQLLLKYEYLKDPYTMMAAERQQIVPFYQFHYDSFKLNYTDEYYLSSWAPLGYKFIFKNLSPYFHPLDIANAVSCILFLLCLFFSYATTKKFFGFYGAVSACLILTTTSIIYYRLGGGMTKAFAYPIFMAAFYCLINNKLKLGLLTSLLGFCFYPMIGLFIFVLFAMNEYVVEPFIMRNKNIFAPRIFIKRSLLFLVFGLAIIAVSLPVVLAGEKYGKKLSYIDVVQFPEFGKGGRYPAFFDLPHENFIGYYGQNLIAFFERAVISSNFEINFEPVNIAMILFMSIKFLAVVAGMSIFVKDIRKNYKEINHRIIITYLATMTVCFFLSVKFFPNLFYPQRYVICTLPIVLIYYTYPCLLKLSEMYLGKLAANKNKLMVLVFCVGLNLAYNASHENPLVDVDQTQDRDVYEFVETLPKESVFAGWPGMHEVTESVEYITARRVYYSWEPHQAMHDRFLMHMRGVAENFFDAYLADSIEQLIKFRNDTGVRYMIVKKAHFMSKNDAAYEAPDYFKPFDKYINDKLALEEAPGRKFILPALEKFAIFDNKSVYIIDLNGLEKYREVE